MRRVALLITALILFAAVIRIGSDAYESHSHGHKTLAHKPGEPSAASSLSTAVGRRPGQAHDLRLGFRITAMDEVGDAASEQRALAVVR
jgi:hypothetical protein